MGTNRWFVSYSSLFRGRDISVYICPGDILYITCQRPCNRSVRLTCILSQTPVSNLFNSSRTTPTRWSGVSSGMSLSCSMGRPLRVILGVGTPVVFSAPAICDQLTQPSPQKLNILHRIQSVCSATTAEITFLYCLFRSSALMVFWNLPSTGFGLGITSLPFSGR